MMDYSLCAASSSWLVFLHFWCVSLLRIKRSIESFVDSHPPLVLEDYFSGKTRAFGILFGRGGEVKRQFSVDMVGT